jgi:PAS domain S-box-containing protein
MPEPKPSGEVWLRTRWVKYGAALLSAATGLAILFLWPVMHDTPFIILLAAVIVTARLFGFGPALLCTACSTVAIDYFFLEPRFSFSLSRDDYARLLVFVTVSVITAGLARKRWQAESRAGQIQRWMASIVESSDDAILTKDKDGIITSWNPGAERLYGYAAAEVIGRPVSILSPSPQLEATPGFLKKLWQGESVHQHGTERIRKDGSRLLVDLSLSPVRNERGEIIGASSIAHDITMQRRAEEALRRNEKLATAGRMAAAVAHEINNPLEAVTNLLYLARHHPDRAAEYLDMADKEVHRIAEVAQQMMGIVREPSAPALLDVSENMDQVLQLYLRKLSYKQIRVEKHYGGNLQIWGFVGELRQLFSNLIINAVDAMETGGRLVVHVSKSHQWRNGSRAGVRVTIADNGSGIPHRDLGRIFEPFYTTKADLGTGLGLWVSHAIVQKHEGTIRVRSRAIPGSSGTVFSVFLPQSVGKPGSD